MTPRHVSLVALPDASVSTLFGIFDVMNAFALMGLSPPGAAPFHIEIVGEATGPLGLASGVAVNVQRAIDTVDTSEIVIVPSVVVGSDGWRKGRYPHLVDWLRRMYDSGAVLCSACSGIFRWLRPGSSTAGTRRCISNTHGPLRPPIQPFRFIRSECSSSRVCVKSW